MTSYRDVGGCDKLLTQRRDVGEKQVWDVGDEGKKPVGYGIFLQQNLWEVTFNIPTQTVKESESLALKMGQIVKDNTGSGRWEVG